MHVPIRTSMPVLFFLGLLASPSSAIAQDAPAAEALFLNANKHFQTGDYERACPGYEESHRLDPRAGTLHALAVCRDRQGRIATAVATYSDYIRMVDGMTTAFKLKHHARVKEAKQRREALASVVPELTLTLPSGAPDNLKLMRDGVAITAASLGIAIPVDPGEHILSVQVGDSPVHEQRITLEKSEKKSVVLELPAAPQSPSSPTEAASASAKQLPLVPVLPSVTTSPPAPAPVGPTQHPALGAQRISAIAIAGLGLAGIGLGAAMGAMVLDRKGFINSHCSNNICDLEGDQAIRDIEMPGLVSTIGIGVGAAGLVTAVVLWLTASEPAVSLKKGAAAAPRNPTGIVDMGPHGGVVGVKGVF